MHYVCPGTCNLVSDDADAVCTDKDCVNYGNELEGCECEDGKHTSVLMSGLEGVLDEEELGDELEAEEDDLEDEEDEEEAPVAKVSKSALDDIEERYLEEEIERTRGHSEDAYFGEEQDEENDFSYNEDYDE